MNAVFKKLVYCFGIAALALLGQVAPSQAAIFLTDEALAESEIYAANFPQVGYVYSHSATRGWQGGSGTYAVNDKTVITAAHVLAGDDGLGGGIDEVRFYIGPSIQDSVTFAFADHWNLHPEYVPNGLNYGDFDIAVISLETPIPGLEPVQLYTGGLAVGMEISAAGYGNPGTSATGEMANDQVLRAGTNVISGFGGNVGSSYQFDHPNFAFVQMAGFDSPVTNLEWQSSPGDSGGGWFVGDELAAVNSFSYFPNRPGFVQFNSSGAVQTGLFAPWINQMATSSVPEPSSFVFMTMAMLAGGATRRLRSAKQ